MTKNNFYLLLLSMLIALQYSCAALVAGGGAAAVAVAKDKRTAGRMVEDESIELKFIDKYNQNKKLSSESHINATSYNGWLLLSGETPYPAYKRQIEALAQGIPGIERVFNEIKIESPSSIISRSNDTYITSRVKTALLADEHAEAYNVKVVTENGITYLMGLLTREQADTVVAIVKAVSGVQRVVTLFDIQAD